MTLKSINEKMSKYRWTICGLLFAATTFNYLDRQVISLLKPFLDTEFGWTNSDYANITAVFQFAYAIFFVFAGRFVDRVGTKWGYALALTLWTIGSTIHAWGEFIGQAVSPLFSMLGIVLPVSVLGFMVSRFILAIGEAGNFPAAIKATAEWFPKKERSFATGIFNSGANIGAVVTPLTVPLIAVYWGWEWAFIIIGGISFVWLPFWFRYYDKPQAILAKGKMNQAEYDHIVSDSQDETGVEKENKTSWFKLLKFPQTWSFVTGKFLTDGVWWFFLFWLPDYLKVQFGMTGTEVMLPLSVLYTMTMVGSIGGGWFPTFFIYKGYETYRARLLAMLVIAVFPVVVLFAQSLGVYSWWFPVILIGIGASAHQAWSANLFTTVSDMFPKNVVASVTGIGGLAGGLGGVAVTKIGGYLFDYYELVGNKQTGYTIMFVFCALAYLLAWSLMKAMVPKYKPVVL
jgi:MFS transporter, ACS family, hexuronate transporter